MDKSKNSKVGQEYCMEEVQADSLEHLQKIPTEENLWDAIIQHQNVVFKTFSGLCFQYELRKGKNGKYTKELWIDRRKNSKSLSWSSIQLAYRNIREYGAVVERPKALGDIRGVTYVYGIFYRFGLIDVPEKAKEKMKITKTTGAVDHA